MSALLCPVIEIGAALLVEENDKFTCGETVLRPAEAKDFHASSPGDFFRRAAKCRDRIRKARAVHMQQHSALFCEC